MSWPLSFPSLQLWWLPIVVWVKSKLLSVVYKVPSTASDYLSTSPSPPCCSSNGTSHLSLSWVYVLIPSWNTLSYHHLRLIQPSRFSLEVSPSLGSLSPHCSQFCSTLMPKWPSSELPQVLRLLTSVSFPSYVSVSCTRAINFLRANTMSYF